MKKKFLFVLLLLVGFHTLSFAVEEAFPQKQVPPHVLVVMGATGDLAQKKLIPALFNLFCQNKLPENFLFVGVARNSLSREEFHQVIYKALENELTASPEAKLNGSNFVQHCYYFPVDFSSEDDYRKLKVFLTKLDEIFKTKGNRLFYLATPSSFFSPISKQLRVHELAMSGDNTDEKWSRIVIEKPFGHDLLSAQALQKEIMAYYDQSQIYLMDHFLGKEVVQNLLTLRFSNAAFTRLWDHHSISHVEITVSEDIGIGSRGKFWEETGMLRDIFQNHLMQLLALVAMEPPLEWSAEGIRDQKVKVLNAIRPFSLKKMETNPIRGQYGLGQQNGKEVVGYRQENDVSPQSNVETFMAARLYIDNERWQGVPFYLKAGKRLSKKLTEIVIYFQDESQDSVRRRNVLVIRVQPDEEIKFNFWSKDPQAEGEERLFSMRFNYASSLGIKIPDAYEVLLQRAMEGQREFFVRIDEILASWKLLDPVLHHWKTCPPKNFPNYSPGSEPEEVFSLFTQDE